MPSKVNPVPDGHHTLTPYLICDGAAAALDFYKRAFGAEEVFRMEGPAGKVGHAEMRIGDSVVMLADGTSDNPTQAATILLYVEDCDASYRKALAAGGSVQREPADQFYGDRTAGVNAGGVTWWLHTHVEDVSPEEMEKRVAAMQS